MDVARLELLRELADRGTVSAVADAVGMTPSAVSQQLKILGREVGVTLLEPDGRRLRLTDAGHALVRRADDVLAALARAGDEMDRYRTTTHGSVRIALFPSGAALLLASVLAGLTERGITAHASDEDVPASEVPRLLADYDVVLTHRDERAPGISSPRVAARTIMREPIDLVVPRAHPLAHREHLEVRDLHEEQWISVRDGFPVDDVLLSIARITGVEPRVVQRINDFRVIEELVAAGHGVALMPRYATANPDVVRVPFTGVRAARLYDLATRPGAEARPVVAAVIEAFEAAVPVG